MTFEAGARFIRFDRFAVDAERRLLLRDGVPVRLTSRTFDLLLTLLDSRGALISKRDLLARVWPNQFIEEGNLTVHISALRKALGERRGENRFVVTAPGEGYRFVADVHHGLEEPSAPPVSHSRRPRAAAAAAAALTLCALLAVAVMARNPARAKDHPAASNVGMTTRLVTALGDVSSAIISHDGRSFVYVEFRNGMESLWLGSIAGEPPHQLRPPEDVDYTSFAFTPDGNRILYAARGALYELPIAGGVARKARDGVGRTFSVSPDGGRVAFVRDEPARSASSLVIADAAGRGGEQEVAVLHAPAKFSAYGAAWSPDGARLAIGASTDATPGQFRLTSVRLSDGALEPLDTHRWDEIGKITWLQDRSGIVFQAVGARSDYHIWYFEMASAQMRCVTPDLSRYGRASVSVSDDGRSLLAVRGEINSSVWVGVSNDARGARAITNRSFGRLDGSAGLAWMPDTRIVYASFSNNSSALSTMEPDGSDMRPLTTPGFVDRFPRPTSDGRYVVFESNRGGGTDIWRVDVDGSHLRRLTESRNDAEPVVTPDARWVLYTHRGTGTSTIWKASIDGGSATRIGPAGARWPSVSPDGTLLADASSDSNGARGLKRLAVLAIGDQRPVAQFDLAPGGTMNNGIHWSPDGSALIYRNFSGGLWRQPLSGTVAKLPDFPDQRIYSLGWTRNGKRIAMSYGDEVRDVVLMSGFR